MLEIDVQELQEKINNQEDFILLDVRRDDEHAFAQIEGSVHIPLHSLEDQVSQLDQTKEIIVYCHHGMRSLKGAEILLKKGFPKVINLTGGIHRWSEQIDPSVPTY